MCGIAGCFSYGNRRPVEKSLVEAMTETLAHRGPDGSGYYYSPDRSLGFGHRRLAIIDLATGQQPMANEDGTVWVTFNGEIYNYKELRTQLCKRGHRFATASDTEVIVHAYEEWGVACAARFNGIFAFAVWDEQMRRLYLARDHFGVKPLYYAQTSEAFLFASEMKALLCAPRVSRAIDLDALHMCFALRHTPSPYTLFKSIRKLPAASYMVVDHSGAKTYCYWSLPPEIDRTKTEAEWVEQLSAIYPQVVKRQMVADTPIGLSLSGGVDSNTLLALMSRESPHVHTFTVGFEGNNAEHDELDAAREAAQAFDANFACRRVSEEDYAQFMQTYLWHLEEPIGNESAAAYYFVANLARENVKVLLSGQGADEPFAGYGRHLAARYMPLFGGVPGRFWELSSPFLRRAFRGSETLGRAAEMIACRDEVDRFVSVFSITTPAGRRKLFNEEFAVQSNHHLLREYVRSQLARAPLGTMLEKMTYMDARTSLVDNLLLCGDKMAMAASVEMRVPFLDLELMKVAETIPGTFKVRGFRNKVIHKKVCERWLPPTVVHRRKVGFHEGMAHWMRRNLDVLLTQLTSARDSVTQTLLNPAYVRQLQQEHRTGKADHQRVLFLLLSIETWKKVFA